MLETREYRPVAALDGAAPVKFKVTLQSLFVEFGQPYVKLSSALGHVRFERQPFGLQRLQAVRVTGGASGLWEVTLMQEDAAELQGVIDQAVKAAAGLA